MAYETKKKDDKLVAVQTFVIHLAGSEDESAGTDGRDDQRWSSVPTTRGGKQEASSSSETDDNAEVVQSRRLPPKRIKTYARLGG